jgi:hypothetical protein
VYANAGAEGTLSGASLTAATYQNGANLGLAMLPLGAALAALTLLFTVIAISVLLPKSAARV